MSKRQSKAKALRNWFTRGSGSSTGTPSTSTAAPHLPQINVSPSEPVISNTQPSGLTVPSHPVTTTLQPPPATWASDYPRDIGPPRSIEQSPSATTVPQPATTLPLSPGIVGHGLHLSFFENAHDMVMNNPTFINAAGNSYVNTYASNADSNGAGKATLLQNIAKTAFYDSAAKINPAKCDPGSRLSAIEEITDWITDESASSGILCMTGTAGLGKTAVKRTVADQLSNRKLLAASFFFWADDPLRNNGSRFIATIAYQLAQFNKRMEPFLYQAVEEDPFIFDRTMQKQSEVLIIQPFLQSRTPSMERRLYPIIIDGLDECQGHATQTEILRVLRFLVSQRLPFKFCISSRPEYPVRSALEDPRILKGFAYHINLKNHDATNDIRGHLIRNLRAIARTSRDPRITRALWPSDEEIEQLVENASGHFIYAATVVKFIDEPRRPPFDRLREILTWAPGAQVRENPFAMLDSLYTHILEVAQSNLKYEEDPLTIVRILRKISLYDEHYERLSGTWYSSVSVSQFEVLLQLDPSSLSHMLCDLYSLIDAGPATSPSALIEEIKPHHKSFTDFLIDPNRNKKFYISDEEILGELAGHCFDLFRNAIESDFLALLKDTDGTPFRKGLALHSALCRWPELLNGSVKPDLLQPPPPSLFHSLSRFATSGSWKKLSNILSVDAQLCRRDYISLHRSVVTDWTGPLAQFVSKCSPTVKSIPEWQTHLNEIEALISLIEKLCPTWPDVSLYWND